MVVAPGRRVGVDLGDVAGDLKVRVKLQGAAARVQLRAASRGHLDHAAAGGARSTAAWRVIEPISWAL